MIIFDYITSLRPFGEKIRPSANFFFMFLDCNELYSNLLIHHFDAHGAGGAGDDFNRAVDIYGVELAHLLLGDFF